MKFVFDDEEEILTTKYTPGGVKPKLSQVESYTLAFAYDYTSLYQTKMCFDNPKIPTSDYHELYYLKQEISIKQLSELISNSSTYRFHPIDYSIKRKWLFDDYAKILNQKIRHTDDFDKLPTLYQIAVYTTENKSPRIIGFIGNYGIFHLIWFDYEHSVFPMDVA